MSMIHLIILIIISLFVGGTPFSPVLSHADTKDGVKLMQSGSTGSNGAIIGEVLAFPA